MFFHLFLARGVFLGKRRFCRASGFFFLKLSFSGKKLLDFRSPIFFHQFLDWLKLAQLFIDRTVFFFTPFLVGIFVVGMFQFTSFLLFVFIFWVQDHFFGGFDKDAILL